MLHLREWLGVLGISKGPIWGAGEPLPTREHLGGGAEDPQWRRWGWWGPSFHKWLWVLGTPKGAVGSAGDFQREQLWVLGTTNKQLWVMGTPCPQGGIWMRVLRLTMEELGVLGTPNGATGGVGDPTGRSWG